MITAYGYFYLAMYILMTELLKVNFWQLQESSRSLWIAGALVVFLIAVRFCRSTELRLPGPLLH